MLTLVIGGSGSGKSEYAENYITKLEPEQKIYLATMYPWDEESKRRIERHRNMRAKKNFQTIECFYGLKEAVDEWCELETKTVFLDCMSNLVANEMYCNEGFLQKDQSKVALVDYILAGIDALCSKFEKVVIVSNDVFQDGVDYNEEMQRYLKNLARINEEIAKRANLVVEVVCGIPITRKGEE